ncbi:MAG: hypothetical protein R3C11_01455 [Planctomycetaceae bacterium]
MNIFEAVEWADTAMTVGMLVLTIGCPVMGVTAVAAKVIIKQATILSIRHCVKTGLAAGVTATACAFFAMQPGEGGGSSSAHDAAVPGVPVEMLEAESFMLVIDLNENGDEQVRLQGELIDKDGILKELLPSVVYGKLLKVEYAILLPGEHGEWNLYMREIESSLENMRADFEFIESPKGGSPQ